MIDSQGLMIVAIPTAGLQAPTMEHSIRRPSPSELGIKYEPGKMIDVGPSFAPVKRGQTIITESGYAVHVPHMIGSETKVKKLGGGYYLVTTKPIVYGAKPKTRIMTEAELVEKFNGKKVLLAKDEDSKEAKLQNAILQLLTMDPKIYYEA